MKKKEKNIFPFYKTAHFIILSSLKHPQNCSSEENIFYLFHKKKRVKFVMTTEMAVGRVAGRQICSKHVAKNTLTWFEGSKNVALRSEMTGVAVNRRLLCSPRQR